IQQESRRCSSVDVPTITSRIGLPSVADLGLVNASTIGIDLCKVNCPIVEHHGIARRNQCNRRLLMGSRLQFVERYGWNHLARISQIRRLPGCATKIAIQGYVHKAVIAGITEFSCLSEGEKVSLVILG